MHYPASSTLRIAPLAVVASLVLALAGLPAVGAVSPIAPISAATPPAATDTASRRHEAPATPPLPARQVHLDFHTSEHIPGIGAKFDKAQWQAALREGRVNWINLFAKCHHGWSYYPTEVGSRHPNLSFDLLGAQIEACHEIGVRCPIYFTVGWSVRDAEQHPDWCARDRNGALQGGPGPKANIKPTDTKPTGGWVRLCPAADGPYHALILRQVEELCRKYPADGFWFDIYHVRNDCYCATCTARMRREGVDLADSSAVERSHALALKEHMRQLRALIARHHPRATVFFNSATHPKDKPLFTERLFDLNTQQELEDLPTTWGGYDKLPLEAKYHLGQGSDVVAMSGKFHKSWGEFGGFKAADAIKYEAAAMIAFGAACNFGDQLHPCGEMDVSTYRNIGEAYRYVEQIEQYGPGGVPVSRLGFWPTLDAAADNGLATMLLELHRDFVVADERNLPSLSTLVIPSRACLAPAQAEAIAAWVARGGKLLLLEAAALDRERKRLLFDIGATYEGASPFHFDYTVARQELGAGLVTTPFLNYKAAVRVKPAAGRALAVIREPYFNRTYAAYSSHANTPYKLEDSPYAAVMRHGNVIFFAHALDRLYNEHGVRLHRDLVRNALDLLETDPVLRVRQLPSSGRVSLLKQEAQRRYVAHLLYSPVLQRGSVKVIEDFPTIGGVALELRVPEKVRAVRTVPGGEALAFTAKAEGEGAVVRVAVPAFTMHTAVVFEY